MDNEDVQQIRSTPFNMNELKRMIHLIPETDPRTREYGMLLESIERFLYFANVLAEVQAVVGEDVTPMIGKPQEVVEFNPPVVEEEKFDEPEPETEYTLADIKAALSKVKSAGKIGSPKDWIKEATGVEGLSAIPEAMYPMVMQKLIDLEAE